MCNTGRPMQSCHNPPRASPSHIECCLPSGPPKGGIWTALTTDRNSASQTVKSMFILSHSQQTGTFHHSDRVHDCATMQISEVERLYLGCLESAVGDALAELQPALPMLTGIDSLNCSSVMHSIDDLSTQLLRSRLDNASSMKSLRRLLAALQPLDESVGVCSSGECFLEFCRPGSVVSRSHVVENGCLRCISCALPQCRTHQRFVSLGRPDNLI